MLGDQVIADVSDTFHLCDFPPLPCLSFQHILLYSALLDTAAACLLQHVATP